MAKYWTDLTGRPRSAEWFKKRQSKFKVTLGKVK